VVRSEDALEDISIVDGVIRAELIVRFASMELEDTLEFADRVEASC